MLFPTKSVICIKNYVSLTAETSERYMAMCGVFYRYHKGRLPVKFNRFTINNNTSNYKTLI